MKRRGLLAIVLLGLAVPAAWIGLVHLGDERLASLCKEDLRNLQSDDVRAIASTHGVASTNQDGLEIRLTHWVTPTYCSLEMGRDGTVTGVSFEPWYHEMSSSVRYTDVRKHLRRPFATRSEGGVGWPSRRGQPRERISLACAHQRTERASQVCRRRRGEHDQSACTRPAARLTAPSSAARANREPVSWWEGSRSAPLRLRRSTRPARASCSGLLGGGARCRSTLHARSRSNFGRVSKPAFPLPRGTGAVSMNRVQASTSSRLRSAVRSSRRPHTWHFLPQLASGTT